MIELAGWGRYPRHETEIVSPADPSGVSALMAGRAGIVARGCGRAYGDAAIGEQHTLLTGNLDRLRSFDPQTGRVTAEAGVTLADLLATFVPRRFFPPVVPGTKFVTIGGMIAADVHGKNHHRAGGFGDHVERLRLALASGETVECSPHENPDLFAATIGGMGLTGTIVEASFRLMPIETSWIRQRTVATADLDEVMTALRDGAGSTYSVAWIDCLARGSSLGRSLVYFGEHATRAELAALRPGAEAEPFPKPSGPHLGVPVDLPGWTLNPAAVRAHNEFYYRRGRAKAGQTRLTGWDPYFFPLDGIANWNRIYGRRGFLQHQCVIPTAAAQPVLAEILDRIAHHGNASFLAVLKQLGGSKGMMSFPLEGYTLALDLRVNDAVFPFLDELDRLVATAGGRLYLAKDGRQSRATFEAGYPRLGKFRDMRHAIGANGRIASRQSKRLAI